MLTVYPPNPSYALHAQKAGAAHVFTCAANCDSHRPYQAEQQRRRLWRLFPLQTYFLVYWPSQAVCVVLSICKRILFKRSKQFECSGCGSKNCSFSIFVQLEVALIHARSRCKQYRAYSFCDELNYVAAITQRNNKWSWQRWTLAYV